MHNARIPTDCMSSLPGACETHRRHDSAPLYPRGATRTRGAPACPRTAPPDTLRTPRTRPEFPARRPIDVQHDPARSRRRPALAWPRLFLAALGVLVVVLGVRHARKVADDRSAFRRWQPQIQALDEGVGPRRRFNYPNPPDHGRPARAARLAAAGARRDDLVRPRRSSSRGCRCSGSSASSSRARRMPDLGVDARRAVQPQADRRRPGARQRQPVHPLPRRRRPDGPPAPAGTSAPGVRAGAGHRLQDDAAAVRPLLRLEALVAAARRRRRRAGAVHLPRRRARPPGWGSPRTSVNSSRGIDGMVRPYVLEGRVTSQPHQPVAARRRRPPAHAQPLVHRLGRSRPARLRYDNLLDLLAPGGQGRHDWACMLAFAALVVLDLPGSAGRSRRSSPSSCWACSCSASGRGSTTASS